MLFMSMKCLGAARFYQGGGTASTDQFISPDLIRYQPEKDRHSSIVYVDKELAGFAIGNKIDLCSKIDWKQAVSSVFRSWTSFTPTFEKLIPHNRHV